MSQSNHKLQHQIKQEQDALARHTAGARAGLEFTTAEEAIRADADATVLPPAIAERLKKSIQAEPPPSKRSWWKRIFGH